MGFQPAALGIPPSASHARRAALGGQASLADPAWHPLTRFTTADNGTQRTATDLSATGTAEFHRVEITLP